MHFFSPANVMKLLENVRGAKSSPETIATVMALGKQLGKVAVLAGNCDGFIGNRMLQYYTGEAEFMLEEGATPEQIDRVAEGFGMAMGPMAMRDMAGMDTSVLVRKARRETLPPDERLPRSSSAWSRPAASARRTARATTATRAAPASPTPRRSPSSRPCRRSWASRGARSPTRRSATACSIPLVNEGAKELEEGIALRAGDIDVAWVNGYGFPAHRGGPMFWGEADGLERVLATARMLGEKNGRRWRPAPLLERLVAAGKGFADFRDVLEKEPA